ncbi:MAG: M90 family metallopeptidase [Gemmatimonadota bacterium]
MFYLLIILLTSGMFAAAFRVGSLAFRRLLRVPTRKPIQRPVPVPWPAIINRIPVVSQLTPTERQKLLAIVQDLVDTRSWQGCGGLELTEETQVLIAAQAGVLVLGHNGDPYPGVETILVYPSTFRPRRFSWTPSSDEVETSPALGEAWHHGVVILAWDSVKSGAENPFDGRNVTFHEFAHQLDGDAGAFDGVPLLGERSAYTAWAAVLDLEFERLTEAAEKGEPSVLDYYGATDRSEFFAVATEAFFEKPQQLKEKHAELYARMAQFYRQDPAAWPSAR